MNGVQFVYNFYLVCTEINKVQLYIAIHKQQCGFQGSVL